MNRSLSLVRYARTDKGWRRGAAVVGKNGRIKADCMMLSEKEVQCPDGRYQIVRYEGAKPAYTDLGNSGRDRID